jgi:DNA-binding transcriptional ArsR family regulator
MAEWALLEPQTVPERFSLPAEEYLIVSGQIMEDVTLDRDDIAALASDVRVAILKSLDTRPMTTSELADGLGLAKSTIHEHLTVLADADLVTHENVRKWRDYTLTRRARRILHPGRDHRIVFLLGTSLVAVAAGVLCVASFLRGFTVQGGSTVRDPLILYAGEALLCITIALWYLALRCRREIPPIPE